MLSATFHGMKFMELNSEFIYVLKLLFKSSSLGVNKHLW